MKIKLAILENDSIYLQRLVSAFNVRYADKLEIYSFTNLPVAIDAIKQNKIDILLANEVFEVEHNSLPDRCALAYLVSSGDIGTFRNEMAISKFQKADLIYKQILNIYSENSSDIIGIRFDDNENTKIIAFLSPAGGTGCSTVAAACALNFSQKNKKVLFLSLEMYGSTDVFFSGEGTGDFSDIIYTIKSKKGNMPFKLESTVKQDPSGVYYYSASKTALDMQELKAAEIKKLLSDLKLYGAYDYIILDFDFALDDDTLDILKDSNRIVLMSDGSLIANKKLERAIDALNIIEQQKDHKLVLKTGILYNRVSSHTSSKPNLPDINEYGGIKRYEGYTTDKIIRELSSLAVFDSIA